VQRDGSGDDRVFVVPAIVPQPPSEGEPVAFVVGFVANGVEDGGRSGIVRTEY
jgi:hypothetical protein